MILAPVTSKGKQILPAQVSSIRMKVDFNDEGKFSSGVKNRPHYLEKHSRLRRTDSV